MGDIANNRLNLVPAIRSIEAQIREITAKYHAEIAPYESSLKELRKINRACEKCCGKGKVLRQRICAEDDRPDPNDPRDWIKCNECDGTGLSRYKKE